MEKLLARYKRALEGLTPAGSEFADNPEGCARWVSTRLGDIHEIAVKATKRAHDAEAINADLLAALEVLTDHASETYPHFESERGQRDIAQARAAIKRAKGAK